MNFDQPLPSIPGYAPLNFFDHGGMASIYKTFRQEAEARGIPEKDTNAVIIKILTESISKDSELVTCFLREAFILKGLAHPNIVKVLDVGQVQQQPYLVMEYLSFGNLKSRLRESQLPLHETVHIIKEISSALEYLHNLPEPIVHRDLKPANILFRDKRTPVLIDFGIARSESMFSHMTQAGKVLGTPYYMSPERVFGESSDHRSDLYSLGVICYELLTGQLPFYEGNSTEIRTQHAYKTPPLLPPELSEFQELISLLLKKKPEERPDSARFVIDYLDKLNIRKTLGDETTVITEALPQNETQVPASEIEGKQEEQEELEQVSDGRADEAREAPPNQEAEKPKASELGNVHSNESDKLEASTQSRKAWAPLLIASIIATSIGFYFISSKGEQTAGPLKDFREASQEQSTSVTSTKVADIESNLVIPPTEPIDTQLAEVLPNTPTTLTKQLTIATPVGRKCNTVSQDLLQWDVSDTQPTLMSGDCFAIRYQPGNPDEVIVAFTANHQPVKLFPTSCITSTVINHKGQELVHIPAVDNYLSGFELDEATGIERYYYLAPNSSSDKVEMDKYLLQIPSICELVNNQESSSIYASYEAWEQELGQLLESTNINMVVNSIEHL